MSALTAEAQLPDDPFEPLEELTLVRNIPIRRDLQQIRKNLIEARRMLLMMEIDADYRRMFPPVCVPSR